MSEKPKFNPDAPFEAVGTMPKPKFDPSKPFKAQSIGPGEAIARGAAQGLTMNFADELAGALGAAHGLYQGAGLAKVPEKYREARDVYRAADTEAQRMHPEHFTGGELGGGIASSFIPGLGVAKAASLGKAALQAGKMGLIAGLGGTKADLTQGEYGEAAKDAALGGALAGGTAGLLGGATKLPEALKKKAEGLAVAATGATRNQAEKFAPNAGRELLDQGIVGWLTSPKSIAKDADKRLKSAGDMISKAIKEADASGYKVTPDEVLGAVNRHIEQLKGKGTGFADQRRALEKIKEDLAESIGGKNIPLSKVEQEKRSFGNVNWMDPDKAMAKKGAYRALKGLTEDKLAELNPELQQELIKSKNQYGLLAPIQEAAERRAIQLQQHPSGGFLDTTSAVGGAGLGGLLGGAPGSGMGALLAPVARRIIAPRINSALAKSSDVASKGLKATGLGLLDNPAVLEAISRASAASSPAMRRQLRGQ